MAPEEATSYIESLLNKNLRVTTTDGRLFWGQFKCTDPDANVVLTSTYEYSPPSQSQLAARAADQPDAAEKIVMDMQSRYLGLVVVPGKHITKLQVEEFASQMRR